MEFKNDQFEKNAAKTLQTLQELKQKLNNNFSTKGAEELNRAIKSVDVSPITKGLDEVQLKFSALQIAGKRVIENIVDASMNAVHQVTSKLTGVFNQIKVGGATRAQNIESAKFMLSGLGIEWADIVEDINYGVQDTAYGLDAAAKVASQLVASNVTLGKDMQSSLRAVSGVAAMTKSTYEEIGHIFTSVAGQGKLMTMQLQQFSLRGLNVAADLAKAMNTTEAEIRDMVTKGKIDFMTFAKAMDELYGEHAKEANKTFSGALSNTKAALSRLGADIQSQKFESFRIILLEVTTQLKDFKKAIKPAEDAIIEMMAAVGNLVANFVKTANLKAIAEKLVPPIKKAAEYVRDFANAWRELREEATPVNTMAEYIQKLKGGMEETTEATDEALTSIEKLVKASDTDLKRYAENAWAIWNEGKFGNGQDRIDALQEDYELTQAYVDKMIELGWDEAKMQEFLTEQREKAQKQEARQQTVNRLKTTVAKVLNIFTNLKTVLHNVTSSVVNILKATFSGLSDAISGKGSGFLDALIFLTGKLADFTSKIAITKERAEKIRPIAKAIGDVIVYIGKGIYNCIKFLITLIGKASESKLIKGIFEAIGKAISSIFEGLKKIYTKMKESGAWDKFIDILKTIGTWLGERLIDGFNLLGDVATTIGEGLGSIFGKVVDKITDLRDKSKDGHSWLSKIGDFFKEDILSGSWLTKLKDTLNDIFGTGKDIFQNAYKRASDFINGLVAGFKSLDGADWNTIIKALGQIALTFSTVRWLFSMISVNKSFNTAIKSFNKLFESLGVTIKKYGKRADAQRFESFAKSVAILVGSLVAMMLAFAWLEGKGFDATRIAKICGRIIVIMSIIVGAIIVLTTWLGKAAAYTNTSKSINILGRTKIPALALTIFSIGYLLKTLIESVMTIYNLVGSNEFSLKRIVTVSVVLIGVLAAIMGFVTFGIKAGKSLSGMTGFALTIIAMGVLFNTLLKGFKKILKLITQEGIKRSDVNKTMDVIKGLIGPILIFGGVIALISKIPTNAVSNTNPFKGMLGMFAGLAILIRFGFQPLLETLADLRKSGNDGITAINDFKSIVTALYVFVGILTIAIALLDRSIFKGDKVVGGKFVDGKYIGEATKSGTKSLANNKLVYGVIGIVAGIAAMFYTLSLVMKNMKGVDSHSIARLKEMVEAVLIVVGLISVIMSIVGALDQTKGVPLALAAVAGLFLGVAAIMAAMAYSIKTFSEAIQELVNWLPQGLKKLEEFFELIEDYDDYDDALGGHSRGGNSIRNKLLKGAKDTASLLKEAFWIALAGWTEPNEHGIGEVVNNLFTSLIIALNSLADSFIQQGPELVNAADRCALGFMYFLTLVTEKLHERGRELFKSIGASIVGAIFDNLGPEWQFALRKVGILPDETDWALTDEWYEKQRQMIEEQAKVAENQAKTKELLISYFPQLDPNADATAVGTAFSKTDDIIENSINKVMGSMNLKEKANNIKTQLFNKYMSGQIDASKVKEMFNTGDFSALGLGLDISIDDFTQGFNDLDLTTNEGIDNLISDLENGSSEMNDIFTQWGFNFEDYGEDNGDAYTDALRDSMLEVTTISSEAAEAGVKTLKEYQTEYFDAGKFCTQGFADGLLEEYAMQRVKLNAYDVVDKAKTAMEERAQEASPSKLFHKIGEYITVGFANGIVDAVSTASGAADEVGRATILSMRETIKRASFEAVEGIDNPRITPILDLSNVTEGIGEMRGLFDTTPAYKLAMATSGEAKTATRNRLAAIYQNGSNYDDTNAIGAINSLNSEVATLKDAINGMQVVIDGKALVGQIATPMDKALGKMAIAGRRGI